MNSQLTAPGALSDNLNIVHKYEWRPRPSSGPMTTLHPEVDYQKFLAEGSFYIQRSRATGRYLFYPRVAEPLTGSTDLEWVEACGQGVVYSTTVIRQKPPTPSYNLALIDLAEGPRLMSRVVGVPPEAVKIGMAVKAKIVREADQALLVFEPA
jgi:uncharacterized OB-fold protein